MTLTIRDERHIKALSGLSKQQFDTLLDAFTYCYEQAQQQAYQQRSQQQTRWRKPGGGRKGRLPTHEDKLLFLLYYYKTYVTFDVLGTQFAMARSKANENLHKLSPILYHALVYLDVMPHREFNTPEELKDALGGIDEIIIDATERSCQRSQDYLKQREHYSGKKKITP